MTDLDASKEYILDRKFISVYFGGGTPSLVKSKNVEKILLKLLNNRMLENDCEISFEFNPKEVSLDYVTDLSNMGVNRASIGIQSFDEDTLKCIKGEIDKTMNHLQGLTGHYLSKSDTS